MKIINFLDQIMAIISLVVFIACICGVHCETGQIFSNGLVKCSNNEDGDIRSEGNLELGSINQLERVQKREVNNVDRIFPVLPPPLSKTEVFDEILRVTPFNTTMNFIVPGAKVHLAHNTEEGSLDHLAMQAFFGLFWAIAWLTTVAIPTIITFLNFQPFGIGRSLGNDQSFNLKWKLDKRVADAIGLNWDTCLQKTICQAHQHPEKYGVLGTAVQLLFPVPDNIGVDEAYHSESNTLLHVNETIGQDCDRIYRCFFDVLDVLMYLKGYCYASRSCPLCPN